MPETNEHDFDRAKALWLSGESVAAAQAIYPLIPPSQQVTWASSVLERAMQKCGNKSSQLRRIAELASNRSLWTTARKEFSALRQVTLELENRWFTTSSSQRLLCLHYLAENVVKLIYNATNPSDEFDEDAGEWVIVCFRDCLIECGEDVTTDSTWQLVTSRNAY